MSTRASYFRLFLDRIRKTLVIARAKEVHVGTDADGNKYFERLADPKRGLKKIRRVEPVDSDITKVPTLPVEWMTWLQDRRKDPPTQKEIEDNYIEMMKTKYRAEQLEKREMEGKYAEDKLLAHGSQGKYAEDELLAHGSQKVKFPKYEEYESVAGESLDEKKSR